MTMKSPDEPNGQSGLFASSQSLEHVDGTYAEHALAIVLDNLVLGFDIDGEVFGHIELESGTCVDGEPGAGLECALHPVGETHANQRIDKRLV